MARRLTLRQDELSFGIVAPAQISTQIPTKIATTMVSARMTVIAVRPRNVSTKLSQVRSLHDGCTDVSRRFSSWGFSPIRFRGSSVANVLTGVLERE